MKPVHMSPIILKAKNTDMTVVSWYKETIGAAIDIKRANMLQIANIIATRSSLKSALVPKNTEANAPVVASLITKRITAYHTSSVMIGNKYTNEASAIRVKEPSIVFFRPKWTKKAPVIKFPINSAAPNTSPFR